MTIDGNNDPEYVVFGYGSLIFRVRKDSSLTTHQPANIPLAPTARHQRKYVGLSLFVRCTHYGSSPGIPQRLRPSIRTEITRPPRHTHSTLASKHCGFRSFYLPFQSPGRVVTLVHQEDWAAFSSAVRHTHLTIKL